MTTAEAKQKLVNWAAAQVGYAETGDNWNKYAPKWTEAGGWNAQSQPWCDVFVDVGFIETFGLDLASRLTYQPRGGFSALCSQSAQYYKNNGAWYNSPQVGDQIFFNLSGGINHTGIVVSVSGGYVSAIEGNSSDMVRRNSYVIGSSYIAGYGRPNWAVVAASESPADPPAEETPAKPRPRVECLPMLQRGDKSEVVRAAQFLLNGRGCSVGIWGADSDFGVLTLAAVKAFQRRNELEADGIIGPETWAALLGVN